MFISAVNTNKNAVYAGQVYKSNHISSNTRDSVSFKRNPGIAAKLFGALPGKLITDAKVSTFRIIGNIFDHPKMVSLPERLEFAEARTISEARDYAHNVLKIDEFRMQDLELANWVNGGITKISNLERGILVMPRKVVERTFHEIDVPASEGADKFLFINNEQKAHIHDIIAKHIQFIETLPLHKKCKMAFNSSIRASILSKLDRLAKEGRDCPFIELQKLKASIEMYADYLMKLDIFPYKMLHSYIQNPHALSILKRIEPNIISKTNLQHLSNEEYAELICKMLSENLKMEQKGGRRGLLPLPSIVMKQDEFSDISHEMGHFQHLAHSFKKFANKKFPNLNKDIDFYLSAGKISSYATTSPMEFVAECYRALADGNKLSDEVMDMYEFLHGPIPRSL